MGGGNHTVGWGEFGVASFSAPPVKFKETGFDGLDDLTPAGAIFEKARTEPGFLGSSASDLFPAKRILECSHRVGQHHGDQHRHPASGWRDLSASARSCSCICRWRCSRSRSGSGSTFSTSSRTLSGPRTRPGACTKRRSTAARISTFRPSCGGSRPTSACTTFITCAAGSHATGCPGSARLPGARRRRPAHADQKPRMRAPGPLGREPPAAHLVPRDAPAILTLQPRRRRNRRLQAATFMAVS